MNKVKYAGNTSRNLDDALRLCRAALDLYEELAGILSLAPQEPNRRKGGYHVVAIPHKRFLAARAALAKADGATS